MNTYGTPQLQLVKGEGSIVTDADGKEYVDLLAGIAVNALGHGHPALVDAVSKQTATLGHISNFFGSDAALNVATELRKRFGDDNAKVFFCNSGGEANEAAFKLSRLTGRKKVLAAVNGFHGRTMGALSLTGQPSKREPFAPLVPRVEYYRYGDIDHVRELVGQDPDGIAAIFLEPIQGETGVVPAPEGFLQAIRELCDEHGILMVVDEVQTGVGRTGTFFAHEAAGITPDIVTMAKGLAGGMPIGAVIANEKTAALFTPGAHGTTFGGNPIACAAANAVLEIVDDAFCAEVKTKGETVKAAVEKLAGVDYVRGRGLMLGVVLTEPVAKEAVRIGLKHGVILNAPTEKIIRLTPPLVISDEEIDRAVVALEATLSECLEATR
ncbi:acetylornithine transaminase [uncultured Corynebacterium sp.]|uniref:acetylornithine transaminase n=1 Tax=uncultured Corynebacterium sp. TaxID=159447 RepID=UPI0026251B61|nr:acetylornithine transaminase [uncultured Corynebacterium sp.]